VSRRKQSGDLYRVKIKKGTHLASSRDSDGALRGILFDDKTHKLVAHAEWEKVDESEEESDNSHDYQENQQKVELSREEQKIELSPEAQKAAQLAGEELAAFAMFIFTEYVAPPVKRWWQNNAIPTMKEKWKILTENRNGKQSSKGRKKSKLHTNEIFTADETVQGMFSHVLEEKYEKYVNDMTSEEAQRELLDIFILSALLSKKIRKLSNARIIKNEGAPGEYLEGQKVLERLTTPEFIGSINQILENNPQLMKEKTADLSGILERNLVLNGQYVPIEIGKFKEAMTL
jgi:hypothetical protein